MTIIEKLLFGTFIVATIAITAPAKATYNYYSAGWDVKADPGTYNPVTLGQDIALSACGTKFSGINAGSWSEYSLCNLTDLSDFSLAWFINVSGGWQYLSNGYVSAANGGLALNLTTGAASSFFQSAGTYSIALVAYVGSNQYISTPNNGWVHTGNNSNFVWNGFSNFSGATTNVTLRVASPVPEPEGMLLLILPLVYIARKRMIPLKLKTS